MPRLSFSGVTSATPIDLSFSLSLSSSSRHLPLQFSLSLAFSPCFCFTHVPLSSVSDWNHYERSFAIATYCYIYADGIVAEYEIVYVSPNVHWNGNLSLIMLDYAKGIDRPLLRFRNEHVSVLLTHLRKLSIQEIN